MQCLCFSAQSYRTGELQQCQTAFMKHFLKCHRAAQCKGILRPQKGNTEVHIYLFINLRPAINYCCSQYSQKSKILHRKTSMSTGHPVVWDPCGQWGSPQSPQFLLSPGTCTRGDAKTEHSTEGEENSGLEQIPSKGIGEVQVYSESSTGRSHRDAPLCGST